MPINGCLCDFPPKKTSSCVWDSIPVDEVFYIGIPVVQTDRGVGKHISVMKRRLQLN